MKILNMIILFLDLMESSGDNGCNCIKPCHRVSHDAVLGAAQLSQFNVDQIQKEDTHMSRRIKQQFITAREAAQRVDADKADTNKDLFLRFLESLQNSTEVIVSTLNYWKRETLNDTFFYRAEAMLKDNTLLLERHNEIRLLFTDIYFDRASQDRFFLCIEADDEQYDPSATRQFLESLNPTEVAEVEN